MSSLHLVRNATHFARLQIFACTLVTSECEEFKKSYTKITDAYGCFGVIQLYAGDRLLSYLVLVTACVSVGKIGDCDVYRVTGVQFLPMWKALPPNATVLDDDRIGEVRSPSPPLFLLR